MPDPNSGKQLPPDVRSKMERAFGADLSQVRIHPNSTAATVQGAKAFTEGNQIHFATGAFQPESRQGKELLAHELAHVLQQKGKSRAPNAPLSSTDKQEIDQLVKRVLPKL